MALVVVCVGASGAGTAGAAAMGSTSRVRVTPSGAAGSVGYLPQIWQTYNNCGPTSVVEVLAHWGITRTQYQTQLVLRADNSPSGMAPYGVPSYARSLGMGALLGVEGTPRLIKALVSNGFPPIVNQWYSVADHTRHYRPIQSYDDRQGVFVSSDPFGGPGHAISYADFATMWAVSHKRYMVLYPPAKAPLLAAVLASAGWKAQPAYQHDLARAEKRLRAGLASTAPGGSRGYRYYAYLNVAWDEVELGRYAAARRDLRQAETHGANPILAHWIDGEIPA
jgi:uncharacterized protein